MEPVAAMASTGCLTEIWYAVAPMASTDRKHIKGIPDKVVVRANKHSNRIHVDVTLTSTQERRLLKMLIDRNRNLAKSLTK